MERKRRRRNQREEGLQWEGGWEYFGEESVLKREFEGEQSVNTHLLGREEMGSRNGAGFLFGFLKEKIKEHWTKWIERERKSNRKCKVRMKKRALMSKENAGSVERCSGKSVTKEGGVMV